MADGPINKVDDLLKEAGAGGPGSGPDPSWWASSYKSFGPSTAKIKYAGWSPVPGSEELGPQRQIVETVNYPNWNGGTSVLGTENPSKEDIDEAVQYGALALSYIGMGLELSSLAVGQFAKNDFRKDIQSAKKKLDMSQESAVQNINALNDLGGKMTELSEAIDEFRDQLNDLASEMRGLLSEVATLQSIVAKLTSDLNGAIATLGSANANLVAVKNSRGSYPAGTAGTQQWANAVKAAQTAVTNAKTAVTTVSSKLGSATIDTNAKIDEYNDVAKAGFLVSKNIETGVGNLSDLEKQYATLADGLNTAMKGRSEAVNDMVKAQETLAGKMRTAFAVSQSALGARGIAESLNYIRTREYYRGSAYMVATAYEVGAPYIVPMEMIPYTGLIKKAIISAGKTMQTSGNFQNFALDFGEATMGLVSMGRLVSALENASNLNATGQEVMAWEMIARQTAVGCEILGTMGETASQFVPIPIPVGPGIKPAMKFAGGITSGSMQTLVSAGYKASKDRFMSEPLGSGRISGFTILLFGPFVALGSSVDCAFFNGEPPAEVIRAMASSGAPNVGPQSMIIRVELRPTIPDAENPYGTFYPPIYTEVKEE